MYIVADCETTSFEEDEMKLLLICALKISEGKVVRKVSFKTFEDFEIFLKKTYYENNKKIFRVYFHNLRFDVLHMKNVTKVVLKNSLVLKARHNYAEFRDSLSILLSSVEDLGKALNLPKLDMKKDDLRTYCFRDCEIVYLSLEHFASKLCVDVENLSLTLGSEMHKMFHSVVEDAESYTKFATEPTPEKPFAYDYRRWYFGARCEVYLKKILKKAYSYDINSMYAYVQTKYKYPKPPYLQVTHTSLDLENDKFFGAVVEIEEQSTHPFIPVRNSDGRLVWANGVKTHFLFREELEYVLSKPKNYRIIKVLECHYCSSFEDIFAYINDIYEKRKASTFDIDKAFHKACLVRSYGKFAEKQNSEDFVVIEKPDAEAEQKLTSTGYKIAQGSKGYPLLYTKSSFRMKRINLVIASRITALSRLLNQKYIDEFEDRGISVAYTDTDSFIVENNDVQTSNEIGMLKLEKEFTDFQAVSRKCYISKEIVKIKGVPNKLPLDEKLKYFSTGVKIDRPSGYREFIKKHKNTTHIVKKCRGTVDYRRFASDGTSLPLSISEIENCAESNPLQLNFG